MIYSILFTFLLSSGEMKTYNVAEAESFEDCKAKAAVLYKRIEIKPEYIECVRNA